MYYIAAVYRNSDGSVQSTQINEDNDVYTSSDFDVPMMFHTYEQAKEWTKTENAEEWDLGFGGYFDIWEDPESKTIEEIERESEETIEEALRDFIDSCFRQGKDDHEDNILYFMRESCIAESEKEQVTRAYMRVLAEFTETTIDTDSAIDMLKDEIVDLENEVKIYRDFIKKVADGVPNAQELAKELLNDM